jgi:hypothetical protein
MQASPDGSGGAARPAGPTAADLGERARAEVGAGEADRVWERLREDLRELGSATWQVAKVYGLRASASARKAAFAIALGVVGALVVVAVAIAAGLALVAGLSGGLAELFGRAWAGQLAAGALVLAALGGGAAWWFARGSRRRARKLQSMLAARPPAQEVRR